MTDKAFNAMFNTPVDQKRLKRELKSLGPRLTAKGLVEAARNNKKKLPHVYECLEWNDSIAGEKYRVIQARNLIMSVEFVAGIRGYESVYVDGARQYVEHEEVVKSVELTEQLLQNVLNDFLYLKEKHQRYRDYFGDIFDSIDEAEVRMRDTHGKAKKGNRTNRDRKGKAKHPADKKGGSKHYNSRDLPAIG